MIPSPSSPRRGVRLRRRNTSVEGLLIWTYREQQADVVRSTAVSLDRLEVPIREDQRLTGAALRRGRARVARALAPRLASSRAFGSSTARRVDDQSRVPGNPYADSREALPRDAAYVHKLVADLPPAVRDLVIKHAKAGTRPPDGRGIPPFEWHPVWRNSEGTPRYDDSGIPREGTYRVCYMGEWTVERRVPPGPGPGGRFIIVQNAVKNRHVVGCLVDYDDNMDSIAEARKNYRLWWGALVDLRFWLRHRLQTFRVTWEMPPALRSAKPDEAARLRFWDMAERTLDARFEAWLCDGLRAAGATPEYIAKVRAMLLTASRSTADAPDAQPD